MEALTVYNSPYPKLRIGKPHDGGYVICDLRNTVEYDHVISGGVANDISFECDLLGLHPELQCDAFDGTVNDLPYYHDRITFHKLNLGNSNTQYSTDLTEYIKHKSNIFMKVDIEGHEFRLLPALISRGLINNIAQLVIEIHTPADIHLYPDYFAGLGDITNDTMFDTLSRLAATHVLVHLHPNNGCKTHYIDGIKVPNVFECTYVRRIGGIQYSRNTAPIPSQLDMKNIPGNSEVTLEGYPYVQSDK